MGTAKSKGHWGLNAAVPEERQASPGAPGTVPSRILSHGNPPGSFLRDFHSLCL